MQVCIASLIFCLFTCVLVLGSEAKMGDELRKELDEVKAQLQAEQDKNKDLQATLNQESDARKVLRDQLAKLTSDPDAHKSVEETPAVYVARERKIKSFSGKPSTSEADALDVVEWVEDVGRYLGSRKWSKAEQVDYLMQHLEGNA